MWKNRLKDIYEFDTRHTSFFNDLWKYYREEQEPRYEWLDINTALYLDYLLMGQYGKREITYLVDLVLNGDDVLTTTERDTIMLMLESKLKPIWDRVYETLNIEYDPLTNYNKVEVYEPDNTIQTDTEINLEVQNKTYGFNDDEAVPYGDTIQDKANNTQGETKTHTGKDVKTTTATQDMGANPSAFQDLLKQEIDTRVLYNFFDLVVKSVADELTILVL